MYRQSRGVPVLFVALAAGMLVFGAYYLWRGVMSWMESGGDITAPATAAASPRESETPVLSTLDSGASFDFSLNSPTPERACLMFRVIVVRARIRECPDTSCRTLEQPAQGAQICVYSVAQPDPKYPEADQWYEVNLDPGDPLPRLGFMRNDVIEAISPTKRPTRTPLPPPTVTPAPTKRPTITLTPSMTLTPEDTWTPNPNALPTVTPVPPTPAATPTEPVRSA
ncbi:MAG: hypothetical protein KF726_06825 [Anaerolineae bacterium]|nr:hypothetical protein [Anaerolineae bacterium]